MREFVRGAGLLGRGFGWWTRRPGLMALGLVPAAIVALLFVGGLIALGVSLPGIVTAVTPFAEAWPGVWATVVRITIGTAMVGAALVILAVSFTALTLLLGEPFYDRIWKAVERDAGADAIDIGGGFWRAVGDTLSLLARGALVAVLAAVIGLIPIVGGVVGAVVGVGLTGWLLADELSSRALSARGIDRAARRELLGRHRARALGFGVATQLCFLVPFGAIATMPAAVAGSTLLARSLMAPAERA
ncbi:EI24 domain-containing protein [Microbacterium sp.]|uniref:EI24 domain-containing protein n=1 Tax=Microbacterium sp. TaxID=51671 RepID=UPI003F72CDF5